MPMELQTDKRAKIKSTSSRRCNFQKKISRRRYIPAASPMAFFRRLIPTDFETELFPSAFFTDGNNSVGNSVGVIRFSGSV